MNTTTKILSLLKSQFGFESFRPNQEQIIKEIIEGKDVLAIMPTGGGKSICYQLPALALSGTAVVISPLIALMKDQVDSLKANGIAAAFYNSSQPFDVQQETLQDLQKGSLDLFYAAPESLASLLTILKNCEINLIAVDEAHCISSWGHDFRPAYTQLGRLKTEFPGVPILALTATADTATQDDISKQLNIPNAEKHIASFDRKNLYLEVRPGNNRNRQILNFLKSRPEESGIIYCLSRKGTEKLAATLQKNGYEAKAYHAGMLPAERNAIQEDFINDRIPVIVATIAFGMGIDKSNVRWVIHFNMPKNIEGYYQEIGRGGRDGLPAHALLFYSLGDIIQLRQFIEGTPTEKFQLAKLERMKQFAEALSCRRIALLNYFGEHISENCGNCDICKAPPIYFDGTLLAQKICSAVARLKEREAPGMLVDVLRGAKNAGVYDKGYHKIKTYAAIKDISWLDLNQYVIQLINQGVLEIRFHQGSRLLLTPLAKAILYEGKNIRLASLEQKKEPKRERTSGVQSGPLFEKLRKLRTLVAFEENVPPYIIFSDASLRDMEEKLPSSEKDFSRILGVGTVKQEKYSLRFLKTIAEHQHSLKPKIPTHEESLLLYNNGKSPEEIAEQRKLKTQTIYGHLLKAYDEGEAIDMEKFITAEEFKMIEKAKLALEDPVGMKAYFEYFDEQVPYWKISYGLYLLKNQKGKFRSGKKTDKGESKKYRDMKPVTTETTETTALKA